MVGAPGFEPGASCAQGRRATRLRYAPTLLRSYSTAIYKNVFNGDRAPCAKAVPEYNQLWDLGMNVLLASRP